MGIKATLFCHVGAERQRQLYKIIEVRNYTRDKHDHVFEVWSNKYFRMEIGVAFGIRDS